MLNHGEITVLGIGQMGGAIATHLSNTGYRVNGYNRTPRSSFTEMPFIVTQDPGIISNSQIVIISLLDEDSIRQFLLEFGSIRKEFRPGTVVIDTTTHKPKFAKTLFNEFTQKGIAYLDAPVSGGVIKAVRGELTMMVGGERQHFNSVQDLLSHIGKHIYYLGAAGAGQATKLVNQVLVGIAQLTVAEAIALGKNLDIDLGKLLDVIENSAGDSAIFRRSAPQMVRGEYSNEFQTHLIAKDLRAIADIIREENLNLPLANLALEMLEEHAATDYCALDAASIFEQYLNTIQSNSRDSG